MAIVKEGDEEFLWMADNTTGQVVKTTLEGQKVLSIGRPDLAAYRDGKYAPTDIAINEERHGGNGDVWVADGYGESYVHRYDRSGSYLGSVPPMGAILAVLLGAAGEDVAKPLEVAARAVVLTGLALRPTLYHVCNLFSKFL